MIISFSGAHGSGKSTIAKMLSEKLGWPRYYIGGLRREAAQKRGLTLEEYNELGEKDPVTDREVDEYQRELGVTQDNFIIEGRTSWYFIPHSYKIYLDVSEEEGAHRIFKSVQEGNRSNEAKNLDSQAEVLEHMQKRLARDRLRYQKYYNIDVYDTSHYDLYLDTTKLGIDELFRIIYQAVNTELDNRKN